MTELYKIKTFLGDFYDTTVYTNGGTYHKVVIENIETGSNLDRKFYNRKKALDFAFAIAEGCLAPTRENSVRNRG